MRARINQIPAEEEATWGAVLATLVRTHPKELEYHWTGYRKGEPDGYSVIDIKTPGEDVDEMRAEIESVVELVNRIVDRDPLDRMVRVDPGLVEVLVD
jgi:predicted RecB family nuclease